MCVIFRFEPAPVQVLLSEDISGSLRKLKVCSLLVLYPCKFSSPFQLRPMTYVLNLVVVKGCCTLASDRFKSLEKRGLVVPTKKSRLVNSLARKRHYKTSRGAIWTFVLLCEIYLIHWTYMNIQPHETHNHKFEVSDKSHFSDANAR